MAVKIIKEGNKKEVFEGWCRYCGCEFEYEKEDLKESLAFTTDAIYKKWM